MPLGRRHLLPLGDPPPPAVSPAGLLHRPRPAAAPRRPRRTCAPRRLAVGRRRGELPPALGRNRRWHRACSRGPLPLRPPTRSAWQASLPPPPSLAAAPSSPTPHSHSASSWSVRRRLSSRCSVLQFASARSQTLLRALLKAAARGLLGLPVGAFLNAFGAIVLGAPVGIKCWTATAYWSLLMSLFTLSGILYLY